MTMPRIGSGLPAFGAHAGPDAVAAAERPGFDSVSAGERPQVEAMTALAAVL
ncbi:hypothetical protein ACFSKW_23215 [Nonomuraea mangrovi]|uniref:Uncharacterized protein n=1 Tax=Nonomuraea mangrovi TaxID=2316207 RepID=A0ABW4SY31_9ACTN